MKPIAGIGRIVAGALVVSLGACGGGSGGSVVEFGDASNTPVPLGTVMDGVTQAAQGQVALPSVCANYSVGMYAQVDEPMKLSFGADGALYAGRQPGSRIHRIAPGGAKVAEFGPPMADPDAVLVDTTGEIAGVGNAVLVGGAGVLAAVFPDRGARVIFNAGFADVDDMKFDRRGRLIFADDLPRVLASTGAAPTVLFSLPSRAGSIAIDDANRIFVALADGTIRIYNADGSVANSAFASGLAGLNTYLAFGPGDAGFGKALYVLNGSELLRFNDQGESTRLGAGFSVGPASGTGFVFGPDNALYVSEHPKNRVLRIARRDGNGECGLH